VTSQKQDNYSGISLTSILAETYNKMILNRLCPVLDPLLRNQQNGFWQNRTTMGQIIALRRILGVLKKQEITSYHNIYRLQKSF
jgi:hypothetical protein